MSHLHQVGQHESNPLVLPDLVGVPHEQDNLPTFFDLTSRRRTLHLFRPRNDDFDQLLVPVCVLVNLVLREPRAQFGVERLKLFANGAKVSELYIVMLDVGNPVESQVRLIGTCRHCIYDGV